MEAECRQVRTVLRGGFQEQEHSSFSSIFFGEVYRDQSPCHGAVGNWKVYGLVEQELKSRVKA